MSGVGKDFYFRCNLNKEDSPKISNSFITDVCKAWSTLSFKNPISKFENEIIWDNSNVKVNNKTVFYDFLHLKGIDYIHNFFDGNKRPLTYRGFVTAYNLDNFPFTLYNGLISAIPNSWKQDLQVTDHSGNHCEFLLEKLLKEQRTSRWACSIIIKDIIIPPTAQEKWNLCFNFDNDTWSKIFSNVWFSVRDAKLRISSFVFYTEF